MVRGGREGAFVYCMVKTGDGKYIYRKEGVKSETRRDAETLV